MKKAPLLTKILISKPLNLRAIESIKVASPDTIYRLIREIDYYYKDNGAHIERISLFSAAVARQMGLNDTTVEMISYTAPMHDIGKLVIPNSILSKPAALDPDEWGIMKQHTFIGAQILEVTDYGFSELAKVIALNHHEKWDGSGYPRGLRGLEIPLAGRITAIADVFDALTSARPYKKPFSVEESFSIIKEDSGRHFDPAVSDAFFAVKDEILAIQDEYKDRPMRPLVWSTSSDPTIAILSYPSHYNPTHSDRLLTTPTASRVVR